MHKYIYDARNALNDHKNTLSWQYTALFIIKKRFCFDSLCDNFSMTFNYIAKIEFENEKLTVQMTTTTTTTERKKPKCNWFGCSFKARQTFKKKKHQQWPSNNNKTPWKHANFWLNGPSMLTTSLSDGKSAVPTGTTVDTLISQDARNILQIE